MTRWDRAAWGWILIHTVLLAALWPLLPIFVDIYYHLNVAQGFRDAGGVVLHDFWEFAPLGRPHVYPPALHVALAAFAQAGLPLLTIGQLLTVGTYPAVLLATWALVRTWLGSERAYWATLCSLVPYSYLLVTCNTVAASWAIVWWLLSLVALHQRNALGLALCGVLAFYTHLSMPWLMLLSWGLLAWREPPLRQMVLRGGSVVVLAALPWLGHLWQQRAAFGPIRSMENLYLEWPLAIDVLALIGVGVLWRAPAPGPRRLLFVLLASLLPLAISYPFRFFSGQGLLALSLLAGEAVYQGHQRWQRYTRQPAFVTAGLLSAALLLVSPVYIQQPQRPLWGIWESALANLLPVPPRLQRSNAVSFYNARLMDPLAQLIRQHSQPEELISCSLPHVGGLLAVLTHRAMSTGMLAEVRAPGAAPLEQLARAHLVVWLKIEPLPGFPDLATLQAQLPLQLVAETEMAYVFRNAAAQAGRPLSPPIVPLGLAQGLLGLLTLAALSALALRARQHA